MQVFPGLHNIAAYEKGANRRLVSQLSTKSQPGPQATCFLNWVTKLFLCLYLLISRSRLHPLCYRKGHFWVNHNLFGKKWKDVKQEAWFRNVWCIKDPTEEIDIFDDSIQDFMFWSYNKNFKKMYLGAKEKTRLFFVGSRIHLRIVGKSIYPTNIFLSDYQSSY